MEHGPYKPMLLKKAEELPEGSDWIYESKLDGYRMLGYVALGKTQLISRHLAHHTHQFPTIVEQLSTAAKQHEIVVDGEIIAHNLQKDRESLYELQKKHVDAYYYIFDLLVLDGNPLFDISLETRRILLEDTLESQPNVTVLKSYTNRDGLLDLAKEVKQEGVVAKKRSSLYLRDRRDRDWLKHKFNPSFRHHWY